MEKVYEVSGMKCEGCAKTVTEKLSAVRGVESVEVNHETGQAKIVGKPFKLSLKNALKGTNYSLGKEIK
ncbi:heavy-metal-associated domain-containing protein [Streptococcus loxodontisalivarius]|uniref:Copper chaperone CopZ n=1 Tax=Streptococcus loxodontisalivarius TaxID=1349415 RepID=A0ABS2PQD9_9STRE|nr:heavy-metal-associated domain-containing protein [Streptococcus loxodontisalivarius]MBM7642257.1 copper chaperone CopZ [Streptococcus loxodontisalivarius]